MGIARKPVQQCGFSHTPGFRCLTYFWSVSRHRHYVSIGVQSLVSVLISALQEYQAQNTPSNFNSTADFATPEDTGAEQEPVVDTI